MNSQSSANLGIKKSLNSSGIVITLCFHFLKLIRMSKSLIWITFGGFYFGRKFNFKMFLDWPGVMAKWLNPYHVGTGIPGSLR